MRPRQYLRVGSKGRVLAALVLVFGVLFPVLLPAAASAHTGDQSYLYLNVGEGLTVEVHMPFVDLRDHVGLGLDGTPAEIEVELAAEADLIAAYAREHTSIGPGGGWALTGGEVRRFREGEYAAVTFTLADTPEDIPQQFEVGFDPFFDDDPSRDALFIVANDFARGIIGNDAEQFVRFTPDERVQTIDLGEASRWKNLTASISLGIDHIRTGPDHILFVAVLLLPSVLVFAGGWKPAAGFGRSLWRVLKIVSMFTLAHSITFTVAGLGLINIDDFTIIEAIIAASITFTALHNLRPIWPEREWILAFGFGLFHGLGFASLVSDLEVARSTQLISLLGRNIGIEIGQAVVVLVTFPALYVLRRTRLYRPFFIVASIVLAVISIGWFAERLFDASDWATLYTDEILEFPRAWWFVAGFALFSVIVYAIERQRGTLIDSIDRRDELVDVTAEDLVGV